MMGAWITGISRGVIRRLEFQCSLDELHSFSSNRSWCRVGGYIPELALSSRPLSGGCNISTQGLNVASEPSLPQHRGIPPEAIPDLARFGA